MTLTPSGVDPTSGTKGMGLWATLSVPIPPNSLSSHFAHFFLKPRTRLSNLFSFLEGVSGAPRRWLLTGVVLSPRLPSIYPIRPSIQLLKIHGEFSSWQS